MNNPFISETSFSFDYTSYRIYAVNFFKTLSPSVKEFLVYIEGLSINTNHDLRKFYRAVASLRNLEYFQRILGFRQSKSYVGAELKIMRNVFKRSKAKDVDYGFWRYDKEGWDDEDIVENPKDADIDQKYFSELILNKEKFVNNHC